MRDPTGMESDNPPNDMSRTEWNESDPLKWQPGINSGESSSFAATIAAGLFALLVFVTMVSLRILWGIASWLLSSKRRRRGRI